MIWHKTLILRLLYVPVLRLALMTSHFGRKICWSDTARLAKALGPIPGFEACFGERQPALGDWLFSEPWVQGV